MSSLGFFFFGSICILILISLIDEVKLTIIHGLLWMFNEKIGKLFFPRLLAILISFYWFPQQGSNLLLLLMPWFSFIHYEDFRSSFKSLRFQLFHPICIYTCRTVNIWKVSLMPSGCVADALWLTPVTGKGYMLEILCIWEIVLLLTPMQYHLTMVYVDSYVTDRAVGFGKWRNWAQHVWGWRLIVDLTVLWAKRQWAPM